MKLIFLIPTAVAVGLILNVSTSIAACTYSLVNTKIEWTGYKFTEKTGVPGTFREVTINQPSQASSIDELIASSSFFINAASVDSGVEIRDQSLRDFFFKTMASPYIRGYVEGYDSKKKTASVLLNMNGVSRAESFKLAATKSEVTATGTIDLLNFMMSKSLESINKKCYDLHKGKDGISKTWSEVGLKISAQISESCKSK
ncbi:MAG: YceI family protein [Bdellovibrionales bacterium]|nr:YceI family protein [Bdellovibrionales bacterium]